MIDIGTQAPAFTLEDQTGRPHSLKDYAGRWVVLYFYPKDDTPGCTKQACQFRDSLEQFTHRQAVVLGVSPDDAASHRRFAEKFQLPFPLLADPWKVVCGKYGVWREKKNYGKTTLGVVRTTYLIDPTGRVAARFDQVKTAGHEAQVLSALDEHR